MISSVMNLLGTSIAAVVGWFEDLLTSTGADGVFLGIIFIGLSVRYLLAPVLGHRGSDTSSKKNSKSSNSGDSDG